MSEYFHLCKLFIRCNVQGDIGCIFIVEATLLSNFPGEIWTGPKPCLLSRLANEIHFLLKISTNGITYSSTIRIVLLKWNYFLINGKDIRRFWLSDKEMH